MIAIVLGTRPEIIKMSPIIRECKARSLDYFILHSGQHYSYDMDPVFFEDLELPEPRSCRADQQNPDRDDTRFGEVTTHPYDRLKG